MISDEKISKLINSVDVKDRCKRCNEELTLYTPGKYSEYCSICAFTVEAFESEESGMFI